MNNEEFIICNGEIVELPSLEVVKPIIKMEPVPNYDWLVHLYYARGDFAECKSLISRMIDIQLNPEYLYFIKGLIEREEGSNTEALRSLQKALEMNSRNIETYKEIGKTLFIMGRFNQALNIFREAETLTPRADNEIFHFIGELLYRSAAAQKDKAKAKIEQDTAKTYFQKAVQCGKKLESFKRLAEIHRKDREYHKAIDVLESALIYEPENTDVLCEIGVLYLKLGEVQRAHERLQEVIHVDKEHVAGLLAFGAILQSQNDVDAALVKYRQIGSIQPDLAELWNNIGLCFFKKRKFIAAISSLRKSVWHSPFNYSALYNLSLIYITAEQYASAFHTLAASINLRRNSSECYMLLGMCLRKLKDTENAHTAFERASDIELQQSQLGAQGGKQGVKVTKQPLIHLNFALFLYENGRFALATQQYNRFLSAAEGMSLPTEYKFQATKLKSLLKISTNNILMSEENATTAASDIAAVPAVEARQTTLASEESLNEFPLEVNAVVSSMATDTRYQI